MIKLLAKNNFMFVLAKLYLVRIIEGVLYLLFDIISPKYTQNKER